MRKTKKNFINCTSDTFCGKATLFSSFLSWHFAKSLSLHVLSEDSKFIKNPGFLKRDNY